MTQKNEKKTVTIDGVEYVRADGIDPPAGDLKIVILQRGWVFIGRLAKDGDTYTLSGAKNIRVWGTSNGLGQLAVDGPTSKTVLDPAGRVTFHELTVVATLDTDESKWSL
jgi:hypothetical protein